MGRGSGRSPAVPEAAILAALLEAAVDAPARPVAAAVSVPAPYGVYPFIILIVYVIVTGGILCSSHCGSSPTTTTLCQDAKPVEISGVPQTNETISAASGLKFTILWVHVEEILLLNKFFPIVNTCLSCEAIAQQSCAMVCRWRFFGEFLRPVFSASRVQRV